MCDQVINSAALAGSALSQVSCSSGAMITGVRFFVPWLVELVHHWMLVGVDREHGERHNQLA